MTFAPVPGIVTCYCSTVAAKLDSTIFWQSQSKSSSWHVPGAFWLAKLVMELIHTGYAVTSAVQEVPTVNLANFNRTIAILGWSGFQRFIPNEYMFLQLYSIAILQLTSRPYFIYISTKSGTGPY